MDGQADGEKPKDGWRYMHCIVEGNERWTDRRKEIEEGKERGRKRWKKREREIEEGRVR